jgi:hypothetical protein
MKSTGIALALSALLFRTAPWAQSAMDMHMDMDAPMQDGASMGMPLPLNQPTGSGTAWAPGDSPVHDHAFHSQVGEWNIMAHGDIYFRYVRQNANHEEKWRPDAAATAGNSDYPDRERGGDKLDFPNWAMVVADRPVSGGDRLLFRAMISLDPWTEGKTGYPLLAQSGEGLVDRQHPHDLFMELAAMYKHRFDADNDAFLYFGLPGEPALGPVAFMHRPSAWNNPDAPLAHHTQDATHITSGVATLGWIHGKYKVDGSLFRGREPDGDRLDIETPGFDSYSLRLTGNVSKSFSAQVSGGYLRDTEPDEPGVDVFRGTASLDHSVRLGEDGVWSGSIIYGFNDFVHGAVSGTTHALTLEADRDFRKTALWGRWESVERLSGELDVPGPENRFSWVHALTAGAGVTVAKAGGMELFLGAQGTVNAMDEGLEPSYGAWPVSGEIFLKLGPAAMKMGSHGHHSDSGMDMGGMEMN